MRMIRVGPILLLLIAWCMPAPAGESSAILIEDVPHIQQKPDFCGEACVAMWLQKLGHDVDQNRVFDLASLDPLKGRGLVTREMKTVLATIGFTPGPVWRKVDPDHADAKITAQWEALQADLARGVPSIVCMRYSGKAGAPEHFRLILGYDKNTREVIYHEPAEKDGAYLRMKRADFFSLWTLKYKDDEWLLVRMRLAADDPKTLSIGTAQPGYTAADYCQVVRKTRPRLPEGFTLLVQPPFVVIGDESAERVRARAERTVNWCAEHLERLYFKKPPPDVYTIWLFKDKASYRKHTKLLFNYTPDTPFGYASDSEKALVMNIATGGGTLCHEMVHAYMAGNFPDCPAWFNEGMGSLYEQCGERDGTIVGFTNWRLRGLQKAIREKGLPSFDELCGTTSREFYTMDRGDNYAQARYLCYYLQEKDLLVKYYKAFTANHEKDPSGYDTLVNILNENDMTAFQKRWEDWVLALRFERR